MDLYFRRIQLSLLKTLLSLSLVCAFFLIIYELKVLEKKYLKKTTWCGSECFLSKKEVVRVTSESPRAKKEVDDFPQISNGSWDAQVLNCSEDTSVRTKDWFHRLDSRFHQFILHRHCRYYPMLINHPEKCTDGEVHLLMVVKSLIEQHDRREAVRKTWGQERTVDGRKITTLFLLGTPSTGKDSKNLQKLIQSEDLIYKDILQWDFMDTFYNLTLKEVNFLKWFNIYCPNVQFIFKGDDDVFVNTHNLLELISFKKKHHKEATLFVGNAKFKIIPIRNRQSKYYIPKDMYDKLYPPFIAGGGFVMSSQLARRLFVSSEDLELFPLDDVFLGMCLQKLHLAPEMHPAFRAVSKRVSPCVYRKMIVVHKFIGQELLDIWRLVHNEELVCA
ncbi:UDP-GlcNAc:betaGal beta-1,3-N-acetylglucosaminyltransferase 7-like [Gouania willdenowi]|uniref:UDP-GlcNAc:betaGal beta-1,3-N-acetylglucosaminyltransferase 7-like n=1 Tax=Gouania willdenowi TaxID=441366 RepID=UPI001055544A|nr:UDP-GlcNAc:betaGal beta-1,3-N-acetylglucosaminyltransferase 7-like [Gouania willdenowi]